MGFISQPGWRSELLEGDGFSVSYLPTQSESTIICGLLLQSIGGGGPELCEETDETALIHIEEGKKIYRILKGDFRKDYEAIVDQGFQACFDFFNSKRKEHGSPWSTHAEDRAGVVVH